jgi:outer membrane protein assembly factor BamD (BamD/ComL family)
LKDKFNIVGTPTVLVYNPKGEQVDRTLGYVRTAEFTTTVDDYQKGIGTLGSMLASEKVKMSDPAFMYKLAERLLSWNRLDDADTRYGAVVKLDPENKSGDADDALLQQAWVCRKKENYDCAVAHAKDCYNRWPSGEMADDATIYIAYYSAKDGKKAEAIAAYNEYLKKWPEGEDVEFAKEQIAELEKPAEATPGQSGSQ